MKRCPTCDSVFPDTDIFCELDGTSLIPDDSTSAPKNEPRSSPGILVIVAVLGVSIGVLLFVGFLAITREKAQRNSNHAASNSQAGQQPLALSPARIVPIAATSPSVEPSPSPSVAPSPSPQASPEPVQLSSNPISTAADAESGPVVITLDSGTTIEADEAWQTTEGIWYRRHGIVTLLDPKHVKAIAKVSNPAPQPAASASP